MNKDALEEMLARGLSLERIAVRFRKDPSTVAYWMRKYGLEAVNRDRHAAKGGVAREQLAALVEAGMSTREIATELGPNQTGVRHWLRRYEMRTSGSRPGARREGGGPDHRPARL
jgi:transposase